MMAAIFCISLSSTKAFPQLSILHPRGGISRVFSRFRKYTPTRSRNLVQSPIHYFKAPVSRPYKRVKSKTSSWMSPIHFLDVPYVSNARPVRPYRLKQTKIPISKPKPSFSAFSSIINHITKSGIFNLPTRFVNNGRPYKFFKLHKRSAEQWRTMANFV